jgi:hypothetical protein
MGQRLSLSSDYRGNERTEERGMIFPERKSPAASRQGFDSEF